MRNLEISPEDLRFIRQLQDFDLVMLLSDIHDHGWPVAAKTLKSIREGVELGRIVTNPLNT